MGRIIAAGNDVSADAAAVEEEDEEPDYVKMLNTKAKETNTWGFDVPPMVANLMDPGARRYLRAGFKLEMSGQVEPVGGEGRLPKKMNKMSKWKKIYV